MKSMSVICCLLPPVRAVLSVSLHELSDATEHHEMKHLLGRKTALLPLRKLQSAKTLISFLTASQHSRKAGANEGLRAVIYSNKLENIKVSSWKGRDESPLL